MRVAELKRDFSRVLDDAERGERTLVLRRGRPVAVVAPVPPQRAGARLPSPRQPGGLLSLVGTFEDWDSMDEDLAEIVAERQQAFDRPAPDLD